MSSYKLKMILIGAGAVGKTSLVHRFINDEFQANYELTVGVDFKTKKVEVDSGETATLSIWDVGGQKRFQSIRTTFYRGAAGALLVFDLTRLGTFEEVKHWLSEVREFTKPDIPFVLIGNKLDLVEAMGEVVDRSEAKEYAEKEGSTYIETSAKTGEKVEEAFVELTNRIVNDMDE
ncbi:MAG: GTP-binding protein [Promethearchaeia archaeon]